MSIRAYLYDAAQPDREIRVTPQIIDALHDQQLLWVDITDHTESDLQEVSTLCGLTEASIAESGWIWRNSTKLPTACSVWPRFASHTPR